MAVELYIIFFAIAFFYSMIGFGGGSSYLAVLSLYNFDFELLRFIAKICNVAVVSGNLLNYYKKSLLLFKKSLPLITLSVPAAYLGSIIKISEKTFFVLLAITLVASGITLFISSYKVGETKPKKQLPIIGPVLGAFIGFLSGMVGIGGGIFLAPILHFTGFASSKQIAAIASLFILVNSLAGIIGQINTIEISQSYWINLPLVICVIAGGQLGSFVANSKFNALWVKRLTAVLIVFVGARILFQQLIIQ